MPLLKTNCQICSKEIKVWPYRLKNNKKLFCSRSCTGKRNYGRQKPAKRLRLKCKVCKKEFIRLKCTVKNRTHQVRCCSIKCRIFYLKNSRRLDKHQNWKGFKVGYMGGHARVYRYRGRPLECKDCGVKSSKTKIQWASLNHKYWDINDYRSLCIKCHRKLDIDSYRRNK